MHFHYFYLNDTLVYGIFQRKYFQIRFFDLITNINSFYKIGNCKISTYIHGENQNMRGKTYIESFLYPRADNLSALNQFVMDFPHIFNTHHVY